MRKPDVLRDGEGLIRIVLRCPILTDRESWKMRETPKFRVSQPTLATFTNTSCLGRKEKTM